MISFNGDFRRKPEQNLSGFNKNRDRLALLENARISREKRGLDLKKRQAIIKIQSMVRSFVARQKVKRQLRQEFDSTPCTDARNLDSFLVRLLLFYDENPTDGQRLIKLSQLILKTPQVIFDHLVPTDTVWHHRLNRFLVLCIRQLFIPDLSHAIPLRIIDVFTDSGAINNHLGDSDRVRPLLESIFLYLIQKDYFLHMRRLLEAKTPPLDGPVTVPPTQFCGTILHLISRPLTLCSNLFFNQTDHLIISSYINDLLVPEMTDPIYLLLLPFMATWERLPLMAIIKSCHLLVMTSNQSNDVADPLKDSIGASSYLLYSLLKLSLNNVNLITGPLLSEFLAIVALMGSNIWKLPRKNRKMTTNESFAAFRRTEETIADDDSSLSSDDEDGLLAQNKDRDNAATLREQYILSEIVLVLTDSQLSNHFLAEVESHMDDGTFITSLCNICHVLMVFNKSALLEYRLLGQLSTKAQFVRVVWNEISSSQTSEHMFTSPLKLLSKGISVSQTGHLIPLLSTFCVVFSRLIITLNDDEFCREGNCSRNSTSNNSSVMPFSIHEIVALSAVLKDICLGLVDLAFPETRPVNNHYQNVFQRSAGPERSESVNAHLFRVCVHLLRQIYTRDLRRNFCPPHHWTVSTLNLPLEKSADLSVQYRTPRPFQPIRDFTREDISQGPPLSTKQMRSITILREVPFVVTFGDRVHILQGLLVADKLKTQGEFQNFLQGPSLHVQIRRTHLYEDSFDRLSPENEPDLRPKLKVQMINTMGLMEAGVDGGGIFREFLSELLRTAFDPLRGFFKITTDNKLYPNPDVGIIVENYQQHYYFIGRMLGKAIYENLLVELPLADFFLSKLAGKHCDADNHQLASLDPVLHKNLLSLKVYDGDVCDLGLDFSVIEGELGDNKVVELKPGGVNIPVTASNRIEYIQLMSDYRLNKQIRKQCAAFREGLNNVVPIEWLFMFSNLELQVLISGAEIPVDTDDLRVHTNYGGTFTDDHPTIQLFWQVVADFSDLEKRQLLKFVTSCSRPPLRGFRDLQPPFTIQDAVDTDRLPSSSTCMNLLKLPPFQSQDVLREKLIYAISSLTGFELS